MGTYGAAKGGINAFTRHAAIELAQYGSGSMRSLPA